MLWFDLDNSPHVPLFRPVLAELKRREVPCHVTARDFAQTRDLLALWNIPHTLIGKHAGASTVKKLVNLVARSTQLMRHIRPLHPKLCISHGSRTQVLAAWRMRVPSVVMLDYEYTEARIFNTLSTRMLMPSMIPSDRLKGAGFNLRKVVRYDAFKEELYLEDFVPAKDFRRQIGVDEGRVLVTVRPPSTSGNYHDPLSESLFRMCLRHCANEPNAHVLIINRTQRETELFASMLSRENVHVLKEPVDGLQLLWHSDVVVSGGGTMNREAALLGVPTFSIFTGRRPYLDELLQEQGKLTFVESSDEIAKIPIRKRSVPDSYVPMKKGVVNEVVSKLLEIRDEIG